MPSIHHRPAASLQVLAGACVCLAATQSIAAESYDNCTGFIDSVPATISTQGTWCLRKDLATAMTTGNAISVATNNVTIDCNGFKLGGLAAGSATDAVGIKAYDRSNITVRNCTVRGFHYGGMFAGPGHLIEGNRFDGNTYTGFSINGSGAIARGNLVVDTGGSTVSPGAVGIVAFDGIHLEDNTVSGVVPAVASGGSAIGIRMFSGPGSIVGNRVRGLVSDGDGTTRGIHKSGSAPALIQGNDIASVGDPSGIGIECSDVRNRTRDNVVTGLGTGFAGCGSAGGNNHQP